MVACAFIFCVFADVSAHPGSRVDPDWKGGLPGQEGTRQFHQGNEWECECVCEWECGSVSVGVWECECGSVNVCGSGSVCQSIASSH